MKLQKLGGYACVLLVLVEIASSSILISIFRGFTGLDIYDPVKMIASYQGSTSFFWAFYILGMLNGILTLLIVLALRERMQAKAPPRHSIGYLNHQFESARQFSEDG